LAGVIEVENEALMTVSLADCSSFLVTSVVCILLISALMAFEGIDCAGGLGLALMSRLPDGQTRRPMRRRMCVGVAELGSEPSGTGAG